MKQIYESEIINNILEQRGHEKSSLHYHSECVESWIEENKGSYPKLCDYESEWLCYINEKPIGEFPYKTITNVTDTSVNNVVPFAYQSAILKGSTKYRDIDTRDILDTFDETKNLELVSVKVPVLTTSNEDGTKTIILTVNEDVTLRGIGDVQDTLDCLTGEVSERIGKIILDGTQSSVTYSSQYSNDDYYCFIFNMTNDGFEKAPSSPIGISCPIPFQQNKMFSWTTAKEYVLIDSDGNTLIIKLLKSKLNNDNSISSLNTYLASNPITINYPLKTESVKTVDLIVIDQDGKTLRQIKPLEGIMHISTDGTPLKPTVSMEIPVEAITQNLASFIEEE